MRRRRTALAALLAVLVLAACAEYGEENVLGGPVAVIGDSQAVEEILDDEDLPDDEVEEDLPYDEVDEDLPDDEELPAVRGLRADFDGENPDHVLEYFLYLLETGDVDPLLDSEEIGFDSPLWAAKRVQEKYLGTPDLHRMEVEPLGWEKDEDGDYLVEVRVTGSEAPYRDGRQAWYVQVGGYMYSETLEVTRISGTGSANAFEIAAGEYREDTLRIYEMPTIAFIDTFDSPATLPPEQRTGYMIVNVPPSGVFGEYDFTYITQEDMDDWSEKLFGVRPHVDPDSRFYDSVSYQGGPEKVYSMYYGWGPVGPEMYIRHRVEDGEDTHYYAEEFISRENEADRIRMVPDRVLRYTLREGMVWSCVDVTADLGVSFYPEGLLEALDG